MSRPETGFSLIELIVVAAIASILALVAVPSWVTFVQRQQLNQAQDQLYRAIQQTQQQAIAQRTPWQVSFRSRLAPEKFPGHSPEKSPEKPPDQPTVEWVRHASHLAPLPSAWQPLQPKGKLYIDAAASTLRQQSGSYVVQFDHQGNVRGQLGRLTLSAAGLQRCVVVATRLGALRKGRGNGRQCG